MLLRSSNSPIVSQLTAHAGRCGYVLGVCNGFQILTETGLLPGALVRNASLHFVCSEPGVNHGSELFAPLLLAEELLTEPLRYADGRLHLPEGPGLGVELDPDAVKRFTRT